MQKVQGIHHITAIAGDPQENLDFYAGVLGMRLSKRSVNQDVPDTYHLFYTDGGANPGTDLTFFPWPQMGPKRRGIGHWDEVYLTVPPGSIGWWKDRLSSAGAAAPGPAPASLGDVEERFGEAVLPFEDPHGMALALIEAPLYDGYDFAPWEGSPVPPEKQIQGLGGVRLLEGKEGPTASFVASALGFGVGPEENGWKRFVLGDGKSGQRIDLRIEPEGRRGNWGVGAVHHVAWRVADESEQEAVQRQIAEAGGRPTPVIDRFWFKSVYSPEPGGALMEVATDGPGFTVDEDPEHLGEALILPPWLEPHRGKIEGVLPRLKVPQTASRR
jgi:glyoxalase family protein